MPNATRSALLGVPLAMLSLGRAAEASVPITPEQITPAAASQVIGTAELAAYRLPVAPLSALAMTPAAEHQAPSPLRQIASSLPTIIIAAAILYGDRENPHKKR